jgi:fimbrial chaperone protein
MSQRSWRIIAFALAGVLSAVDVPVWAGALTVSPLRLELSARHPVATLDVRNEGPAPVTIQLERVAWTQPQGEDLYTASNALIATPSVFDLAPAATQTLRIALRDGAAAAGERAFRLYVRELPSSLDPDQEGLRMALRIGIPVFLEVAGTRPNIVAGIRVAAPGKLELRLRNDGPHFSRAFGLQLRDATGGLIWSEKLPTYLLAGSEHRWSIDTGTSPVNSPLTISIDTDAGTQHLEAPVNP